MTLLRAFIEMLKVSGSVFLLFCIASAIGIFLLILLTVTIIRRYAFEVAN